MHRRFFPTRRAPPTMEIELARRDIVAEDDQRPQPRSAHPNFRINRIRRPFIYKPSELPEAVSHDVEQIPCRYCHDQILSNHYTQHLVNCPARDDIQQEDRSEMPVIDLEATQRQLEEPTFESIVMDEDTNPMEEEPIQIQPINFRPNNSLTYTSEEILDDLPNFADDLEDSTFQPTRHQIRQLPPLEPMSRFESDFSDQIENNPILPSILEDSSPNTTNDHEEEPENNAQNQVAQTESEAERHPHGAFIVRTLETGPNGDNIVRMRVIPLDTIFGRNQENAGENSETGERTGILSLLSMLAALQGGRAAQLGDFLNLLREERGLDKEVLESLPVVTYTEEGFKNVDEESKKCTICLDHYEEQQEVKFLWCMHRFHKGCVDQWLDKHTNCPFCKKDYSEALRDYE